MNIGLIADNTCSFSKEKAKELDIKIVSLYVKKGEEFNKACDINIDKYREYLDKCQTIPTTSQPNPADFKKVFDNIKNEYDAILVPVLSQGLSGTYASSKIASQDIPIDIRTVDTKLTGPGYGFLLENLRKKINDGSSIDELEEYSKNFYKRLLTIFSVGDLKYLYKGGRLSSAKYFMGSLLNLKPIISIIDGELKAIKKERGNTKLIKEFISMLTGKEFEKMVVVHTGRIEDANNLVQIIKNEFEINDIPIIHLDPILMTHLGSSCLGIITECKEDIY